MQYEFEEVRLSDIVTDENVRTTMDKDKLEELTNSIKRKGILEPLVLQRIPGGDDDFDKFKLIAGYRRFEAAKRAKIEWAPAIIRKGVDDDAERATLQLIENIQREEMSHYDQALAFKSIIEERGCAQSVLAGELAVSEAYISQHLSLLKLPKAVQTAVQSGKINWTGARQLMRLEDKDQQLKTLESLLKGESAKDIQNELDRQEVVAATTPSEPEVEETTDEKPKAKRKAKTKTDEDEGPKTLVEQYQSVKLKPLNQKSVRELLIEYAGKLERATSEEKQKEYAAMLKGMELAAGVEY